MSSASVLLRRMRPASFNSAGRNSMKISAWLPMLATCNSLLYYKTVGSGFRDNESKKFHDGPYRQEEKSMTVLLSREKCESIYLPMRIPRADCSKSKI